MSVVAHRERAHARWRTQVPWYQASYNYAANLLHLALDAEADPGQGEEAAVLLPRTVTLPLPRVMAEQELDAEEAQPLEAKVLVVREEDEVTVLRTVGLLGLLLVLRSAFQQALKAEEPPAESPEPAALVAGGFEEATMLLRTTVDTLRFGRPTNIWHWWGVLPPGEEGRVLRRFLWEEVEPTAALLLAAALVERGEPYSFEAVEAPSRKQLERRLRNRETLSPAELMSYATKLVEKMEKAARARLTLGRRRTKGTAGEHYNFACFYSRVAARMNFTRVRPEALEKSIAELARSFANEPRREARVEQARWALKDASLAEVRSATQTRRRVEELLQQNLRLTPRSLTDSEEPPADAR